ncbi:MAG: J domain-containing protein [Syntrophomonadaceae bacterium]|nr:J domain-containing protein [Syntrophomonadaceae bacterium]
MAFRPDYYEILQVQRGASHEDIAAAYQQLLSNISSEPGGNEETRLLQEAYEVLGDPQNRWQYDTWLDNNKPDSTPDKPDLSSHPGVRVIDTSRENTQPEVIDSYRFGFEMIARQPGITLLLLLASLTGGFFSIAGNAPSGNSLLSMAVGLVSIILSIMMAKLSFNIFDNQEIIIKNLISVKIFLSLIAYAIISSIIITIGCIFLIVPGIIFAVKLVPGYLLIIDESLGPFEAISKSWSITKGYKGKIFLFILVYYLFVGVAGSLFLLGPTGMKIMWGIFILVTPLFIFSSLYFYRNLLSQAQADKAAGQSLQNNAFNYDLAFSKTTMLLMAAIVIVGLIILSNTMGTTFDYMYHQNHMPGNNLKWV